MDKYENIEVVGEGSYGIVMKCRHKETGQVVAIKKFLESVENVHVRKLAFREIRMLKRLRHENLVSLIEVFRRKKRFYLVFEYLDHTILDELEAVGGGLGFELSRRHIFQVLRGLNFCHHNHIMHRDVKPENVLVSPRGVIKLCDFGFARIVTGPNESCTDYVATRWYRAPELLVGDPRYGRAVDTWAAGCLYAEMLTGEPIFPGDSDVDQLFRITRVLGGLCSRHANLVNRGVGSNCGVNGRQLLRKANLEGPMNRNSFHNHRSSSSMRALRNLFPGCSPASLDFLSQCLRMDPDTRPSCALLLQHPLFMQDCFAEKFMAELREHVAKEAEENPLLQIRRDEDRRASVISLDEPVRAYTSSTRWQMRLMRDTSLPGTDSILEHPSLSVSRSRLQLDPDRGMSRPRDTPCLQQTYIRRLPQASTTDSSLRSCLLPALASRDQLPLTKPRKRSKLDLPAAYSSNRTSCD